MISSRQLFGIEIEFHAHQLASFVVFAAYGWPYPLETLAIQRAAKTASAPKPAKRQRLKP